MNGHAIHAQIRENKRRKRERKKPKIEARADIRAGGNATKVLVDRAVWRHAKEAMEICQPVVQNNDEAGLIINHRRLGKKQRERQLVGVYRLFRAAEEGIGLLEEKIKELEGESNE